MVWKSWGAAPPLLRIAVLLLAAAAPLCSGVGDVALSFSATPRRVSRSTSAAFAFRVLRATTGGPCADCLVTCQVPYHTIPYHGIAACLHSSADHDACGCCLLLSFPFLSLLFCSSSWLLFQLLLLSVELVYASLWSHRHARWMD